MSEFVKTVLFACAAAITVVAAWIGRPAPVGDTPTELAELIGKPLFPDFEDPYQATNMQVVEYDAEQGEVSTFEIDQKQGLWVIPSHEDYPADAEERLKNAATLLVGLKIINVESGNRKDHALFGVLEPTEENSNQGADSVGKLIRMRDDKGERLAALIVGKEVKGQEGQRYARDPAKDYVYTVKIDPGKVSTKFEDWIEQDVLDLDALDVAQLTIEDYSMNPMLTNQNGRPQIALNDEPRLDLSVRWDSDAAEWQLEELLEFRGDRLRPTELLETEELDRAALDRMKNKLADLQIVDVRAKPPGLGAGLKAEQGFWSDQEGVESLFACGFYLLPAENDTAKLRSSDGQIGVVTKDGIEYTLWFGQIAGVDKESAEDKLRRFVMISTALHEPSFPPPEYEPIPELNETSDLAPAAEDASDQAAPAAGETDNEQVPANDDSSEQTSGEEPTNGSGAESTVEVELEEAEAAKAEAAKAEAATDEAATDEAATDEAAAGAEATDAAGEEGAEVAEADEGAERASDAEALNAERDRIIKENRRKLDEYQENRKKAEDKVKELNFRFADWYYVVSDEVYQQIHLSRADVITEKEDTATQGSGVDAFRNIEESGLSRESDDS